MSTIKFKEYQDYIWLIRNPKKLDPLLAKETLSKLNTLLYKVQANRKEIMHAFNHAMLGFPILEN
jgi:hypothetical protein